MHIIAASAPRHGAFRLNYYEHHLGDFARDTGHLSALEHGIYRLLLDWYYATEKPIPDAQAARLARSPRKAVLPVLEEFFTLDGDVWRHKRVEAEIAKYRDKSAKASRSASARWTNSERTANALPTQCEGNAHQSPVTSNQSPVSQKQEQKRASPPAQQAKGTRLPADWQPTPEQIAWARAKRPDLEPALQAEIFRDYWNAKPGKDGRKVDWGATWRNWIRNGRAIARPPPSAPRVGGSPEKPPEDPKVAAAKHAAYMRELTSSGERV